MSASLPCERGLSRVRHRAPERGAAVAACLTWDEAAGSVPSDIRRRHRRPSGEPVPKRTPRGRTAALLLCAPLLALTAACGSGDDAPAPTPTGTSAEPAPSPATTGPAGPLTGVWDKADPEAPATLTVSDDGAVTLTAEDATCNGEAQRAGRTAYTAALTCTSGPDRTLTLTLPDAEPARTLTVTGEGKRGPGTYERTT
ncbi:predicted protein [Streptomyces albidoflavus]|nr:predicted protein [Streptomyces albidoflavus]